MRTLIALFALFAVMPSPVMAQEATFALSPDLRAANSLSLTPAHRDAVGAIITAYSNGSVSERDAANRIDATLSQGERDTVSHVERSFWVSMQQIYADANSGVEIDPGEFLLLLLGSPSATPAIAQ